MRGLDLLADKSGAVTLAIAGKSAAWLALPRDPRRWSPVGNHLFSDRVACLATDRFVSPAFLHEKPCRNDKLHGNHRSEVFRTCWSATCAFPATTTGRARPCSAMP